MVFVAPSEIGRLLWHCDGAQVMPLRIPNPDAFGTSHKDGAILVDLDSVGHAIISAAGFFPEDASIGQRTIRRDIINANISELTIVDVEALSIGRECQAVRLCQILGQESQVTLIV